MPEDFEYANSMEVYELTEAIKTLTADKNNINDYLDYFPVLVPRCSDV